MRDPETPALTLLLGALIAVAPLAMDIYLASMPSMTRALAATPEAVQLTLSVYMYAWGAAQLFTGPLSDRFGRRPALLWGLAVFVAASVACALAQTVGALIAARAVQAVAMATIAVVPRAVVRDLYAGDRAAYMLSLMAVVLGVAPVVAPIIGSHLHVWFGWQANFVFVAVYGAALFAWVVMALPETLARPEPRATNPAVMLRNFERLIRARRFRGYVAVAAFTMSGLFAFLAGSAFVFVDVLGQGERGFGFLFGAVMLGNISGATIGSRLVRRWGIDRMITRASWLVLCAGLALAALAWAGVRHPLAVVAPMFVYMVGLMTTMPQATAGALTPFPDIAGAASSLLSFTQFVVASTAALAVGLAFDGTPRAMATVIAIAAVLAFVSFRRLILTGGAETGSGPPAIA
jgi:DHA1 family bicyclomycin/chloramphenicol resistance-like MFS transporter